MDGKTKLNNTEFEALLLYVFVAFSMAIRAVFLMFITNENILDSAFYTIMDAIVPIEIWGVFMMVGAGFIIACVMSMSMRKYVFLMIGCLIGLVIGGGMVILGFIAGMNLYTPLQTGIIAFFNLLLLVHGGVVVWRENKKTPM